LQLYRDEAEALSAIPTLRMITAPVKSILTKAKRLQNRLKKLGGSRLKVALLNGASRVGGGSLPLQELPSKCLSITIEGLSANTVEASLRKATPPVIARIEEDSVVMDLRTVQDEEISIIAEAFKKILMEV